MHNAYSVEKFATINGRDVYRIWDDALPGSINGRKGGWAKNPKSGDFIESFDKDAIGDVVQNANRARRVWGISISDLSSAAGKRDRGGLTVSGRSLTKHGKGARPGNSLFPSVKGNPAQINSQAQKIVDEILDNPASNFTKGFRGRFGNTIEVTAPDGRGLVYDITGKFLFFKE